MTRRAGAQAGRAARKHGAGGMGARARGERALGRWELGCWARGALRQRAAGAGRHGVGGQGRAAGRTVRAGHGRPGRGLGAGWVRRLGQLGQFRCTVHLAQFWLGFWTRFDSVFS